MKKVLIGTTALVALAAPTGFAFASDVELSLGGYIRAGVAVQETFNETVTTTTTVDTIDPVTGVVTRVETEETTELEENPFRVLRDGEIHFRGNGTLDNGLRIDARVELEAFSGTSDLIDENWVRVRSQFGAILIGGNDDAAYNIGYVGFTDTFINHASADGTYGFTPAGTLGTIGGSDDISIQYYTPTIAGLQAGISYQPDDSSDGGDDGQATDSNLDPDANNNKVAVGVGYENTFGEIDLAVAGQYITADNDLMQYGFGASVGFAGISLNGRWDYSEEDEDDGGSLFTVGANYSTGPWTFGAGYGFLEEERTGGDDNQLVSVGANYALGDGVTVGGGVEWGDDGEDTGFAGALLLGVSF